MTRQEKIIKLMVTVSLMTIFTVLVVHWYDLVWWKVVILSTTLIASHNADRHWSK